MHTRHRTPSVVECAMKGATPRLICPNSFLVCTPSAVPVSTAWPLDMVAVLSARYAEVKPPLQMSARILLFGILLKKFMWSTVPKFSAATIRERNARWRAQTASNPYALCVWRDYGKVYTKDTKLMILMRSGSAWLSIWLHPQRKRS